MEFLNAIYKCTIPLSYMDDFGPPSHIGTGVLIKTEFNYYLLSAKHVFEDNKGNLNETTIENIVYCKDDNVYPINGRFAFYSDIEMVDVLVCKLDKNTTEDLSNFFEFLPSYLMNQGSKLRHTKDYYIVGYPSGKVKKVYPYSEMLITRSLYAILTAGLEEDEYSFVMEFHKRKMLNHDTGLKISTPDIKGMSGCGLWYKFQDNIYLVGIVHSFNNTASKIIATKIDFVIDILNRKFNDSYE